MKRVLLLVGLALVCVGLFQPGWSQAQGFMRIPSQDAGAFDPKQGALTFAIELNQDAEFVEALVEDVRGQVVDRLYFHQVPRGEFSIIWKGLTEAGEPLPEGRYVFKILTRFANGEEERGRVETRIITRPETKTTAPEALPPKDYGYELDGSVSAYHRYNRDAEHPREDGEERFLAHLAVPRANQTLDATLDVRKSYWEDTDFDGSRAYGEQRWKNGKIRGVFRDSLDAFDDPMKLFNDFRSERKKIGARLDQKMDFVSLSALSFFSEGDAASNEKGFAGRLGLGDKEKLHGGVSYTSRMYDQDHDSESSQAAAADLTIPLVGTLFLAMEYAATRDAQDQNDQGYLARLKQEGDSLRWEGGYLDLGEDFAADFSDPVRGLQRDARGWDAEIDFFNTAKRPFIPDALTARGLWVRRISDEAIIREGDVSLRSSLWKQTSLFASWFGRTEDETWSQTMTGRVQQKWNEAWLSSLQVSRSASEGSESWRGRSETLWASKPWQAKLVLEAVRMEIKDSTTSPIREYSSLFQVNDETWTLELAGKRTIRHEESGNNFWGKLSAHYGFLHRYDLSGYLTLGNRSAFETEEMIEVGMEFKF